MILDPGLQSGIVADDSQRMDPTIPQSKLQIINKLNKMAYVRNWLHCVWGTKYRHPYLTSDIIAKVISHILEYTRSKDIHIDSINGHVQHMHCLLLLGPDKSLGQVMQIIKGESSHWINKQKLTKPKFEWGVEYYAASVSESQLNKVRNYINRQKRHHDPTGL